MPEFIAIFLARTTSFVIPTHRDSLQRRIRSRIISEPLKLCSLGVRPCRVETSCIRCSTAFSPDRALTIPDPELHFQCRRLVMWK